MPKGQINEDKAFLDQAEAMVRACAALNKDMSVWRGAYPHKHINSSYEYDTIVVGMSDDQTKPPAIVILQVWCQGDSARLDFVPDEKSNDCLSCTGPMSGVLEDLREVIEKLPPLFS